MINRPSPERARYLRLQARARTVLGMTERLAEELKGAEEGLPCAQSAARELQCVLNRLKEKLDAQQ